MPGAAGGATGDDVAPGRNTFVRPAKTVNSSSSSLPPLARLSPCTRRLGSRAAAMARWAFSLMRLRIICGWLDRQNDRGGEL